MSLKEETINEIIRIEGGYVNDPSDSGGETNYGITVEVARAWGYMGDMRDLPRPLAFRIYEAKYWSPLQADQITELSYLVAKEVVDTGVNAGIQRSSRILQNALNALNNRQKLYADLIVDGFVGPGTLRALKAYLVNRDEITLCKVLNCLQGAFYVELTQRREKDEKFLYGWFRNRIILAE